MPAEPETSSATTDPASSQQQPPPTSPILTSPSSPKPSPPPIDTNRNSFVQPDTSIMATTPAAMETAMRFDEEEIRKSLHIQANNESSRTSSGEERVGSLEEEDHSNAITSHPKPITTAAAAPTEEDTGPGIVITLLILSGARSTFTLNPGYMKRHNVSHADAMQMTVYNLKECVWRDWKEEELNTKQPGSPHLIRLILLGRLLEDKMLLKGMTRKNTTFLFTDSVAIQRVKH
ncbi:hypothetical protein ABW20_dc0100144 [Dactylellina cionopaga]|nr:hypothetical protein ABW20_dc0100144 [Dactylellina cionopaga]